MALLYLFARLTLAGVFGVSGVMKSVDREDARRALRDFGAPAIAVAPAAAVLPAIELLCAAALLIPVTTGAASLAAVVLLAVFAVAIAVNLARGRRPQCHCFGQLSSAPIGWPTVLRNALLAGVAAFLLVNASAPFAQYGRLSSVELLAAAFALQAVVGLTALIVLLRQNGRLMLRLEATEAKLGIAEPVPALPAGLPVGATAPDFSIPRVEGGLARLREVCGTGKSVLLFIEPDCAPCGQILPDVAEWEREYRDALRVVVISRGTVEANVQKFGVEVPSTVLLQRDYEVSSGFDAVGTPSAVIIEGGRIASPVAGGAAAIRELVAAAAEPAPLRVGQKVPSLIVRELDRGPVDISELRGRSRVLLFWNSSCGYCLQMLDDVKGWESERESSEPELVIVAAGSPAANRAQGFRSTVLLDPKLAVSQRFGANGTPSAVHITKDGTVSSKLAVGVDDVLALIGVRALAGVDSNR